MTDKANIKKSIQTAFEELNVAYDETLKNLDEVKDFDENQLGQVVSRFVVNVVKFQRIINGIESDVNGP